MSLGEDQKIEELPGTGAPFRWSRAAFGTSCVLGFALMGVAVASTWDGLVGRLARTPAPTPATLDGGRRATAPSVAEQALAEARRRLDAGDPAGALSALAAVKVGDPEYPFASGLRSQAERRLGVARAARTGEP